MKKLCTGVIIGITATILSANAPFAAEQAVARKGPAKKASLVKDHTFSETSTVVGIDLPNKTLKLKDAKGEPFEIKTVDEVLNVGKIKVGDRVRVETTQTVGIELKAPGKAAKQSQNGVTVEHEKQGEKPAIIVNGYRSVTAKVTDVKGKPLFGMLLQPQYIKDIKLLRKNNEVQITLYETLLIAVEESAK